MRDNKLKKLIKEALKKYDEKEQLDYELDFLRRNGMNLLWFTIKSFIFYIPALALIFSFIAYQINFQGYNWLIVLNALTKAVWVFWNLLLIVTMFAAYVGAGFIFAHIINKLLIQIIKKRCKKS